MNERTARRAATICFSTSTHTREERPDQLPSSTGVELARRITKEQLAAATANRKHTRQHDQRHKTARRYISPRASPHYHTTPTMFAYIFKDGTRVCVCQARAKPANRTHQNKADRARERRGSRCATCSTEFFLRSWIRLLGFTASSVLPLAHSPLPNK